MPALERAWMSAPRSISACTTGPWPAAAAHISAVCPFQVSFASTFAPALSSAFTASALSGARREHQRRLPGAHGAVRIGAGLQ